MSPHRSSPGIPTQNIGLVNPRLDGDAARDILEDRFEVVVERHLRSTVVASDPAPVLPHAASTTAGRSVAPRLLQTTNNAVRTIIDLEGAFRVTTDVALLRATGG